MQMTLTTRSGKTIYLPRELAIDSVEQAREIPGVVIPGKPGRHPYPFLSRLEPKILRVSGTIHEISREAADHLAMRLRDQLLGAGPMKLRRDVGDDRWIEVECTGVNRDPHRGRFCGRLGSFRITFQADDPYWYHDQLTEVAEEISGFDTPVHMIETENIGGARVDPIIWITGRTVGGQPTVNPSLHNYSTGRTLRYEGTLQQGEILILKPDTKNGITAIKIPDNVEHSGTAQGGGVDTITLALNASNEDQAYLNQIIRITAGAGAGQIRRIIGYSGTSRTAIVSAPWNTAPNSTSQYEVYRLPLAQPYWLYEGQWGHFSGGVNVLGSMNIDYIANGFPLAPGLNRIEVQGDTEHMHVSIIYRARWS